VSLTSAKLSDMEDQNGSPSVKLLTVKQAAERLSLSESSVKRRIADGLLESVHLGVGQSPIRVPEEALTDYVERADRAHEVANRVRARREKGPEQHDLRDRPSTDPEQASEPADEEPKGQRMRRVTRAPNAQQVVDELKASGWPRKSRRRRRRNNDEEKVK